uniref:TonB-dependent receptor domain-containing protein n=1 Tax=uncultured Altererythrobacter sp. TaxID=500840 RepID=UPI002639AAA8|nr:TonB-dependent receptor [uncultured Altererythrobacter sp.]
MKNTRFMGRFLSSTMIAGLAVTAAPALAQDADVTSDDGATEEPTIVVTGSRLNVNPNLEGAAPIVSVSEEQIKATGTARIEDLTNQLPQVFAAQAGEVSNSATGTAQLNLRGLGAVRTLVMIDGRRLPYGSSISSPANLDLIPTQMIERIDILTGGASAVYGSDAVGGVANFILKRDFEGFELDIQGGFQQTGNGDKFFNNVAKAASVTPASSIIDGEEYIISGMLGTNTADGRGNVTISASYEKRNAVTQNNRSYSACTIGESSRSTAFGGAGCVGSGNFRLMGGAAGLIDPAGSATNQTATDQTVSLFFQEADGQLVEFVGGPAQTYNFGQRNFFQRPSERFTLYGKGQYEITDNLEVFADLSYTDVVSDAQIAETASFGVGQYSVNCDNPYLAGSAGTARGQNFTYYDIYGCTAQDIIDGTIVDGVTVSHRNVEGGPRNSRLENSAFRLVAGLRGDFADGVWAYEVFGQYSETSDTSISTNDFVIANLDQALLAVDDGSGNVVCLDPSGGCVPYNPFQRVGTDTAITSAQTDFIQGIGIVVGETTQRVYGANIQGDLGEYGVSTPWAEDGVALLVGVENRTDKLDSRPDEISQVPGGGFTGVGGATLPVKGQVDVFELYGELQIPLIQDKPGFQELILAGQYRFSDYSAEGNNTTNNFTTDAFGVQLTWTPIEDITLRGQFQRAVRAPNVIELYTGQDTGLPNLNSAGVNSLGNQLFDPCASAAPIASLAACQNTGVTAAQYGSIIDVISGQTQSITGGNPNLDPESSDTWTFGAVFTPSFAPGLSITVDYFDITVDDYISAGINAQTTLDNCLATGDAAFCDLITRRTDGSLVSGTPGTGFLATNLNIAQVNTAGFDVQVRYSTGIGSLGGLRFDYAATYLKDNDFIPFPGGDPIDCAGFLDNGCIQPVNPQYRHRVTTTWETPVDGLETSVTWRYFSGTKNERVDANPEIDDDLPVVNFVDMAFFYDINDTITLRGGVLNVLNEQPPVSTSSGPPLGNGNTFPTIYDTARTFFGGVNFSF